MSDQNNSKRETIIKKVKGLLAIANDNHDDDECQSAFLLAQRLMIKYQIAQSEVADKNAYQELIGQTPVTIYKRLQWWETVLASIIAKNFRVKCFTSTKYDYKSGNERAVGKTVIKFYGLESDLEFAKEMYILAYDAVQFYAERFVTVAYRNANVGRNRKVTAMLKKSYIRGFLDGLNDKFEQQVKEFHEEYGLMVLTSAPKVVEEFYEDFSQDMGTGKLRRPPVEMQVAYEIGLKDAKNTDFGRKQLNN